MLYQIISNKKKQYIVLFLVDLCNMGFHSAAVQKMCPTPSTNQPSKFAQLLQLRLGELPGLDVRLRRNEGGVFQWDPVISNTYLHYIILYTHIYFRNHGTKDRSQWSTNSLCCFVFHMFFFNWFGDISSKLSSNIHYSDRNYQYHPV